MSDYRTSHLAADCAERFDSHYVYGRGQLYWRAFERPYLERLFARLGREQPGRYLDFACGTGRVLALGAPYFGESVGIDVSPVMLAEARRRASNAQLILADVLQSPPDVGVFNVISLFRFILSAEASLRDGVLQWLRSVIAPAGTLVVNNHLNRRSAAGVGHRIRHGWRGESWTSPDDRDMQAMLGRAGFTIRERFGFGVVPPWRDRWWLPSRPLVQIERLANRSAILQRYAKDRIYVCSPTP